VGRVGSVYDQVLAGLAPYAPQLRVARAAPGVEVRGQWLNRIFAVQYDGLTLRIAAECKRTLADYANVREGPSGEKLKTRKRDPETGRTYEPYGHCSDANDYFLCEIWEGSFSRFRNGNKKRLTGLIGQI